MCAPDPCLAPRAGEQGTPARGRLELSPPTPSPRRRRPKPGRWRRRGPSSPPLVDPGAGRAKRRGRRVDLGCVGAAAQAAAWKQAGSRAAALQARQRRPRQALLRVSPAVVLDLAGGGVAADATVTRSSSPVRSEVCSPPSLSSPPAPAVWVSGWQLETRGNPRLAGPAQRRRRLWAPASSMEALLRPRLPPRPISRVKAQIF